MPTPLLRFDSDELMMLANARHKRMMYGMSGENTSPTGREDVFSLKFVSLERSHGTIGAKRSFVPLPIAPHSLVAPRERRYRYLLLMGRKSPTWTS
jgi:hypothetical protein